MKLSRKPLALLVSILLFGLPPDAVWGNSDAKYLPNFGLKNRSGNGSQKAISATKIAFDVADVIHDAELINRNTAQLKQRVRLLELKLAKTLREYQTEIGYQSDISESRYVKTSVVKADNVAKKNRAEHTDSAVTKPYLIRSHLNPPTIRVPFDFNIAPPELIIAQDITTAEPVASAVAMPSRIDESVAETVSIERSEPTFDDNSAALEIVESSIVGDALAMNDAILSEMRGGFTTTSGLQVAFGIERAVYVNGALVSTTSLNVLNLGNLTPAVPTAASLAANVNVPTAAELAANVNVPTAAELAANVNVPTAAGLAANVNVPTAADLAANVNVPTAANIAANVNVPTAAELSAPVTAVLPQVNSSAATSPSAASASVAPASTAVPVASTVPASSSAPSSASSAAAPAASAVSTSNNAASSIQTPSVTTTPGSVALIQTGAGNIVVPVAFSASSAGTVVQNSLNNQKIQNITVVNATVNSMQILQALNLQAAISSAINDSVRR